MIVTRSVIKTLGFVLVVTDKGCAVCGGEQPHKHAHRRGLTRTVVAQQPRDLPLKRIERQVVHRPPLYRTLPVSTA